MAAEIQKKKKNVIRKKSVLIGISHLYSYRRIQGSDLLPKGNEKKPKQIGR